MTKSVWSFKQNDYIERHNLVGQEDGVCLALATRWAKMHLKSGGKALGKHAKTNYFEKATKPGKRAVSAVVAEMQAAFDAAREPAKIQVRALTTVLEHAWLQTELDQLPLDQYFQLKEGIHLLMEDQEKLVSNALNRLFAKQNIRVVGKKICNSFQDYFGDYEYGFCYVFRCSDLKHAFGARVEKGYLWNDYYLFDPNSGEMHFDGASQMNAGMAELRKGFGVTGKAERFKVAYSSS